MPKTTAMSESSHKLELKGKYQIKLVKRKQHNSVSVKKSELYVVLDGIDEIQKATYITHSPTINCTMSSALSSLCYFFCRKYIHLKQFHLRMIMLHASRSSLSNFHVQILHS